MDDYYSDDGATFARFLTDYELPEFVQNGGEGDSEKIASLPDEAFADPISRRLPIHDRANTFVSAAYCLTQPDEKQASLMDVIRKRAELLGIADTLEPLGSHIDGLLNPPTPKVAADDSTLEIEIGGRVDKLVLHGKRAGFTAQGWFAENFFEVPFKNRTKVASLIVEAVRAGGDEPADEVLKVAGLAQCDENAFHDQVMLRVGLVTDALQKAAVLEALKLKPEEKEARVNLLHEIDERHNLARYYGERLSDPHRSVYNDVPKIAELIQVGLKSWPLSQWTGPTADFQNRLTEALGEKAATLFKDGEPDREKLASLSEGEVDLIARYAF